MFTVSETLFFCACAATASWALTVFFGSPEGRTKLYWDHYELRIKTYLTRCAANNIQKFLNDATDCLPDGATHSKDFIGYAQEEAKRICNSL